MKTLIVTGTTGAMGFAATTELLKRGYRVVAACRNTLRMEQMSEGFPSLLRRNLMILPLDLSSQRSIDEFVEAVRGLDIQFSLLWNNAGTLQRRRIVNAEGVEMTFAVNYLGTRRLTEALLPRMERGGLILFTSSLSCYLCAQPRRLADAFQKGTVQVKERGRYRQIEAYARSKMLLSYYAQQLAEEHPDLRINCTDPGVVDSAILRMDRWFDPIADVLFRPLCKRPEQGIVPALRAIESPLSGHLFRGNSKSDYGWGHLPYPRRWRLT